MYLPTPPWPISFGLETEVGITVREHPEADVVEESIQLVRCAAKLGRGHIWDYASEDPHQDARGFRAEELRQDTDEANFFSQDQQRHYTFAEIKSDFVLRNGARLYNDHTHPEYSTPECSTLLDLVAQDKAGERILEECARVASEQRDHTVRLYKNNTDFCGHSYGCHENYLISRRVPWERLVEGMTPFLVTRQIFAGAGKVGWEAEDHQHRDGGYQISQRADFFSELIGIDTMNRRPLINTRDEPHANSKLYRRFHVIIGDANLSEFSTWLKVGTTALTLEALSREPMPARFALADPLAAHQSISRDANHRWLVALQDGSTSDAATLQQDYADWVERNVDGQHPEKRAVLTAWKETVATLASDPLSLRSKLDWVAKWWLLDSFRAAENLTWQDPWLQSLDLEYHLLNHSDGLFYAMQTEHAMDRLINDTDITHAGLQPPSHSRAYVRGKCVQKFARDLTAAQWDFLAFRADGRIYNLELANAFPSGNLAQLIAAIDQAHSTTDLVRALDLKPN